MMRVVNRTKLSPEKLAEVERDLPPHKSLREVVEWGLKEPECLPQVVAEVLAQDEYSHDAVVRWREGLYLVYGIT